MLASIRNIYQTSRVAVIQRLIIRTIRSAVSLVREKYTFLVSFQIDSLNKQLLVVPGYSKDLEQS